MEIEVKGHSGCAIEIIKENDDLCILKSTDDKKYFSRLVQQAKKQQTAYGREYQHIRIPQIYEIKEETDRVSIKMEYVYSKNFIGYFETAGFYLVYRKGVTGFSFAMYSGRCIETEIS